MSQPIHQSRERSNRDLEARVTAELFANDAAVLPPLQVVAQGTTVTLRGLVDCQATRRSILAIARRTPGVRRVVDEMGVPVASEAGGHRGPRHYFSAGLACYFEEQRLGRRPHPAVA